MKLAIFNGSPRGKNSNSALLTSHFLEGYDTNSGKEISIHYLAINGDKEQRIQSFLDSNIILFVFPLYTDCMPGMVKEFIEIIGSLEWNDTKRFGFIVQSGFPESVHSTYVERYLEKLCRRMDCTYLGTVIKGGVEGIQIMPASMTRNLFKQFRQLGEYFSIQGTFDTTIIEQLQKPKKMSKSRLWIFKQMQKTGLTNFYWNSQLKKNNAYKIRFDQPFVEPSV
jgi:NAD(P)H-dependent FMN reductase